MTARGLVSRPEKGKLPSPLRPALVLIILFVCQRQRVMLRLRWFKAKEEEGKKKKFRTRVHGQLVRHIIFIIGVCYKSKAPLYLGCNAFLWLYSFSLISTGCPNNWKKMVTEKYFRRSWDSSWKIPNSHIKTELIFFSFIDKLFQGIIKIAHPTFGP